jgi:hypothetical protein
MTRLLNLSFKLEPSNPGWRASDAGQQDRRP